MARWPFSVGKFWHFFFSGQHWRIPRSSARTLRRGQQAEFDGMGWMDGWDGMGRGWTVHQKGPLFFFHFEIYQALYPHIQVKGPDAKLKNKL